MSQQVITATKPPFALGADASFAALALSALLVATAGVIVVRAISSDSSTEGRPPTRPAAAPIALVTRPSRLPSPVRQRLHGPVEPRWRAPLGGAGIDAERHCGSVDRRAVAANPADDRTSRD